MGEINLGVLGSLGRHKNTLNEYDNEVSEELLEHHLEQIAKVLEHSENYVCYVLGMGAQPKSVYRDLEKKAGVELVFSTTILPGAFKILSFVIASHAGLVRILSAGKLTYVVKKLCHMSMVGIYIFDRSFENKFVERVKNNIFPDRFDFGIKKDSSYFLCLVDADNFESSTGIFEVISYGKSAKEFAKLL